MLADIIEVRRRHNDAGGHFAALNHVIEGIDGVGVANQRRLVAAVAMKKVDDRIALRSVFIISVRKIYIHIALVYLLAVHMALVVDLYHLTGMLAWRFIGLAVIDAVCRLVPFQLLIDLHHRLGTGAAQRQAQHQQESKQLFHLLSPPHLRNPSQKAL